jgi:hypothetical protein
MAVDKIIAQALETVFTTLNLYVMYEWAPKASVTLH